MKKICGLKLSKLWILSLPEIRMIRPTTIPDERRCQYEYGYGRSGSSIIPAKIDTTVSWTA